LSKVVQRAIQVTNQDFTVVQGLRSLEEQKANVAKGASQTMKSRHLTGHAVDLAPWVDGAIDWNTTSRFTSIAEAMRLAAIELDVEVVWGAAWQLSVNYFDSAAIAKEEYVALRKQQHKNVFIDAPHFQLSWKNYP